MGAPETSDSPPKLRLKVVAGNALGTVIEVGQELMIGRTADGDGALAADIEISRQHARIASESEGRFTIEDLGSTNGTFVNGRRLERPAALEAGDRIELGASALVVQVSTPQPTPPSSDTIVPTVDSGGPAPPGPAPFALRVSVDPAAGRASVSLDDSSDEVFLVYEEGRWRLAP